MGKSETILPHIENQLRTQILPDSDEIFHSTRIANNYIARMEIIVMCILNQLKIHILF